MTHSDTVLGSNDNDSRRDEVHVHCGKVGWVFLFKRGGKV
jgi:hypothetical protein